MGQDIVVPRAFVDAAAWPVVVLTECGVLPDLERVRVTEELVTLATERGPYALVLDLSQAELVPDAQRAYLKNVMAEDNKPFVESLRVMAVVVRQPVVMHLADAAFWMKLVPAPSRMFASHEDAVTWARGMASLGASGPIPIVRDKAHPRASFTGRS